MTTRLVKAVLEKFRLTARVAPGTPQGWVNSRKVAERLDALPQAGRGGLMLCANLAGFSSVNKSLGHDAAQALLLQMEAQLMACLPGATVANTGAEFLVFVAGAGQAQVDGLVRTLQAVIGKHSGPDGALTAHVGYALWRADEPAAQAMERSQRAMHQAKKAKGLVFEDT